MLLKKKISLIAVAVLIGSSFTGCGSSSFGNSSSTTKIGVFADAPVEGLSYKTITQSGFTDAQGHFKYKDGETIEFKLGTLSLGKGKAGAFVTPYTISDNNNNTATNIAMVLQNFDGNRSNTKTLNLLNLKNYNFSTNNLNITSNSQDLENVISGLLATVSFQEKIDKIVHSLISDTTAKKNMDNYIAKYKNSHDNTNTNSNYKNIKTIPYTVSSREDNNKGYVRISKIGAEGQIKAVSEVEDGKKYITEKFIDGVKSLKIITASAVIKIKVYKPDYGNTTKTNINNYNKGTEHTIIKSEKYGEADCVSTYSSVLPMTINLAGELRMDLLYTYNNLISTTCPAWVVNNEAETEPETFENTSNFKIVDNSKNTTFVSYYDDIKRTSL